MFEKIIGTLGTRIICTILTLVIMIINSNSFGSGGVGTIGLFVLNITILQIITSFVGGPSLVYMLPRHNNFQLIFLSYAFSLLTTILGTVVLYALKLVPMEYVWHLFFSSLFLAFFYINSLFLLSQENLKLYNAAAVLQIVSHLAVLIILIFACKVNNVTAYMYAYGVSYVLSFLVSLYFMAKKIHYEGFKEMFRLFARMFRYGFLIQIANLSQLLNYRLSYYVIKYLSGVPALGLFDMGTKLSEAIWILPKSISTVQYTRISNCNNDKVYAKRITLSFLKLTFIFAMIAVIFLFCIPAHWLGWIFGNEFVESKRIIYALGGGIIVLSCNIILSHYFSGFGYYKINTIASSIGLIVTGGLCFTLFMGVKITHYPDIIFMMGLITSLSYCSSFIYTFIHFARDTHLKLYELRINRQDVILVKTEMKKLFKNMKIRRNKDVCFRRNAERNSP
ncbi:MAG: oligosaccharide flippase family protein [Bacteroidales bacterium]|jgi:O-antigen/teichoic acid export membrane protein|nr:oligosaccharide flippase family protein [Bacteroidales bacterium]